MEKLEWLAMHLNEHRIKMAELKGIFHMLCQRSRSNCALPTALTICSIKAFVIFGVISSHDRENAHISQSCVEHSERATILLAHYCGRTEVVAIKLQIEL